MKYLIAIIFVTLSFNASFAQAEVNKFQAEKERWSIIQKELQLDDKKTMQLKNIEQTYRELSKEASTDKARYLRSHKEQELYRLLSKDELKKYNSLADKTKKRF